MDRISQIISVIEENPGIKFREIMRKTGLKNGVLSYHTKKLEENGAIKIERNPGETRFYPLCVTEQESIMIKSLRQETPRQIMLSLMDEQFLTFNELVNKVHKSQSTVSVFLNRLVDDSIIEIKLVEIKRVYRLKNPDMTREIIQRYSPVLLERTAYNLADAFSNL